MQTTNRLMTDRGRNPSVVNIEKSKKLVADKILHMQPWECPVKKGHKVCNRKCVTETRMNGNSTNMCLPFGTWFNGVGGTLMLGSGVVECLRPPGFVPPVSWRAFHSEVPCLCRATCWHKSNGKCTPATSQNEITNSKATPWRQPPAWRGTLP